MLRWSSPSCLFLPSFKRLSTFVSVTLFVLFTADYSSAQSTRRPIQASQACNGSTLVLSCPRGESIRIWQYGYVPPEVDCSRQLDFNFEIGKDSVSYYSNRFVSVAREAQPNLHAIVRSCNGQQRCNIFVKISPQSMKSSYSADRNAWSSDYSTLDRPNTQPGIRVLFSCELVQIRSICDRFDFVTSGRFHLRSPGYPNSAHDRRSVPGKPSSGMTSCSCELRSNYGFNLVVIEMELANGTNSGFLPNSPHSMRKSLSPNECSSVMRFWNASGHVGILPCVFEPKLRINWHDVIKQRQMGLSLEFSNDDIDNLMTRFWFEIQPRRSFSCPVFGCSLHECSGDADCHNPQHSCCCDSSVGLRVCKPFSPYDRVEQGILNISCNKMVYADSGNQNLQAPDEAFDNVFDVPDPGVANWNNTASPDSQPADEVLLGVVIGCAMFFAFMLLGASVFIYCYCRAQRSAGNLGVRPRLSKIGDNWAITAASEITGSRNDKRSGMGTQSSGGYTLKKQAVENGQPGGKRQSVGEKYKKGGKLPVRKPSFDGESSFIDFDRDSTRNSREQSAESRNIMGECLLKMPEDRLKLLGDSSLVTEGATAEPSGQPPAVDPCTVVAVTAATAVAAEDIVVVEPRSPEVAADEEPESIPFPLVVKCQVVSSESEDAEEKELIISAAVLSPEKTTLDTISPLIPDTYDDVTSIDATDAEAQRDSSPTYSAQTSEKWSKSSSTASTMSGSPVASSVIYETVLLNPPLSLTRSQQPSQQQAYINSSYSNNNRYQQPRATPATPHQRFALPNLPKRDENDGGNTASGTAPAITRSPSKDSLSSVSGIIKLDIISAF